MVNIGGNKVSANQGYKSDSSDGETYAAKKFGGVRRVMDSDDEDNILRGDSVVVSKGGNMNRANNKRDSNAGQYNTRQRRDTFEDGEMKKRKVSVYQYKGDTYQQDDFDDDYGNEGNGRNRQVSYYVNKDVGRQLDEEDDDDDYGS